MKKKLSIALAACAVVLMTGCGKTDKLTCTNEQSFGSATLKTEAVITFKDDYATKTVTTMVAEFDSEDTANSFADNYKDKEDYEVKQDGSKVTITQTQTVSKDSAKADENKKDYVKEYLEGKSFTCK